MDIVKIAKNKTFMNDNKSRIYLISCILLLISIIIDRNLDTYLNFQRIFKNNDETKQVAGFLGLIIQNLVYFSGLIFCIFRLFDKNKID